MCVCVCACMYAYCHMCILQIIIHLPLTRLTPPRVCSTCWRCRPRPQRKCKCDRGLGKEWHFPGSLKSCSYLWIAKIEGSWLETKTTFFQINEHGIRTFLVHLAVPKQAGLPSLTQIFPEVQRILLVPPCLTRPKFHWNSTQQINWSLNLEKKKSVRFWPKATDSKKNSFYNRFDVEISANSWPIFFNRFDAVDRG